jgi:uncharacterized membrane protein YfcA
MHLSILTLILLTLSAFCAGFIDTIAGGGGLITVPALLLAGLPAPLALATNKLQACFGSFAAAYHFMRTGHVHWKNVWQGVLYTLVGASLGTLAVLWIHPGILEKIVPILLLLVIAYMAFVPAAGKLDSHARINPNLFWFLAGAGLGFYDGFFGPGTGTFWAIGLVIFLGMNLQRATMHAKVFNFTSNIVALVWFISMGVMDYRIGLCMAVGQVIGARLGAKVVISHGVALIRPLFMTMVVVMVAVLIYRWF